MPLSGLALPFATEGVPGAAPEHGRQVEAAVNSVALLRRDHYDIAAMVGVLEATVCRLEQDRHVDRQMLAGLLGFFDRFVGKSHDLKEEQGLFPLLAAAGGATAAQVAILVAQHEAQRALLRELVRKFERLWQDQPGARALLVPTVRSYASLVGEHLRIENQWIPEMAACAVSRAQDERLCREFEEIERKGIGATGREWYNQLITDYRDIVSAWGQWPS